MIASKNTEMYFHGLVACAFLCVSQAGMIFNTSDIDRLRRYYACYFNKYFKLKPDENRFEADREIFVNYKIETSENEGEKAPTQSCVQWMCDPKMVWDWRKDAKLETWTYFAEPGDNIESWEQCFKDEEENFKKKNYTFSAAGGVYCINNNDLLACLQPV